MNRLLWLVLVCSLALSASAGVGYLAVIGPAPLRFAGRARPLPHALALLPPLVLEDPLPPAPPTNTVALLTATNPPPAVAIPVTMAPLVPALPIVPALTNPPLVTTLLVTNPVVPLLPFFPPPPTGPLLAPGFDPNDPNSLLTAQMLIHYFRPQGTNTAGTSVLGPLFIPPRPVSPPSSTVRYTTP